MPIANIDAQHIQHDGITTALLQLDHDIDERIRHELLYIHSIKSILNQVIRDLRPCVEEVASVATNLGAKGDDMVANLDAISRDIDAERAKLNTSRPFSDKHMEETVNDVSVPLNNYAQNLRMDQDRSPGSTKTLGRNETLFNTSPPPEPTFKFGGTRKRRTKYTRI